MSSFLHARERHRNPRSCRNPVGTQSWSGRNSIAVRLELDRGPIEIRPQSSQNPAAVQLELGRGPVGTQPLSSQNPVVVRSEPGHDPAGVEFRSDYDRNPAKIQSQSQHRLRPRSGQILTAIRPKRDASGHGAGGCNFDRNPIAINDEIFVDGEGEQSMAPTSAHGDGTQDITSIYSCAPRAHAQFPSPPHRARDLGTAGVDRIPIKIRPKSNGILVADTAAVGAKILTAILSEFDRNLDVIE